MDDGVRWTKGVKRKGSTGLLFVHCRPKPLSMYCFATNSAVTDRLLQVGLGKVLPIHCRDTSAATYRCAWSSLLWALPFHSSDATTGLAIAGLQPIE